MSGRALTLAVAGGAAALLAAAGPAAAEDAAQQVGAPRAASCDPVSGTAALTVVYRDPAGAPAPVVLAVRFDSGLRGPVLARYRFPAATRPGTAHTFHVQWLPGGAYYLDAGPGDRPARTIAVPAESCTVRMPGGAAETAAYADVSGSPEPAADALAHTGAGPLTAPLALGAGALALGAAGLAAARRARAAAR